MKNVAGQPDFDAPTEATTHLLLELLRARRAAGRDDQVVVSSFDWFALDAVLADREHPGWAGRPPRTALLLTPGVALLAGLAICLESGYDEIHAPVWAVREAPAVVARAQAAGKQVVAWTVRRAETAVEMRRAGVDAVICDDPVAVLAALAADEVG